MSAHRNPRRRTKRRHLTSETRVFAAGILLSENPNKGKRHAARMTDDFLIELARDTARAYAPLTVATRFRTKNGRRYADKRNENGSPASASYSSYTI